MASPLPLQNIGYDDMHAGVIGAAEAGKFTILDLFDCLPWLHGPTAADWTAWRAFLAALYGLPMTPREAAIFRECTGRTNLPTQPATEAWVIAGRRARKSAIAAVLGLWRAAFSMDLGRYIAPGETAAIPMLSVDKGKADKIRQYMLAILRDPRFSYLKASEPAGEIIPLRVPAPSGDYRIDLAIRAQKITAGRSDAIPGALLDEVAFWRSEESKNPDKDIVDGIKPGMVNIPGSFVYGSSSPYARRGLLWEKYEEHWGKDGRILVWKAPTLVMNDTPQIRAVVAEAYEEDKIAASAEYGAEFRTDVVAYVSIEAVKEVTVTGRTVRPFQPGNVYHAFVDPAGGSQDSFTWAIAHWDGAKSVLDLIGKCEAPFNPKVATAICATAMKEYGIKRVTGDHWAGDWPATEFRDNGIGYDVSELHKTDIYREWLPHINSKAVELLDDKVLRSQLTSLDRRAGRGGKDIIDHPPGGHDDVCNVAAGALLRAGQAKRKPRFEENLTVAQLQNREVTDRIKARLKDLERRQRRGGGGMGVPSNG